MASSTQSIQDLIDDGVQTFFEDFGGQPEVIACAPGRVNLIGDHVDYCDGFVLPMALPFVTLVIGRVSDSADETSQSQAPRTARIRTTALDIEEPRSTEFQLDRDKLQPGEPKWANFVKGVVANFPGEVPSFEAVIVSSVPRGGGLSSSASLEVATYSFLEGITKRVSKSPGEKARACQRAEHEYANTPCGIMDQLVSVKAEAGKALLIDCRSLETKLVPLSTDKYRVLITNSNVKHSLSDGGYSERFRQSREAAKKLGVESYRDATEEQLTVLQDNDILFRRARHIISEIKRTAEAAEALQEGDFEKFGTLMVESHQSLSNDFEVSSPEQDELVEIALQVPGVLGSRMTGGGFGGCTVTLVSADAVEEVINLINKKYSKKATCYTSVPSDGARLLPVP